MPLLEGLLPAAAVVVETREDRLNIELFPEEEQALGRAVEKRRREFITGRACAREALGRLGLPPAPIGSGAHGEPLWPAGVVGSITHCEGYRACAVARASDLGALGIDAEVDAPLPTGVWEAIAHGAERDLIGEGRPGGRTSTDCCSASRRPSTRHGFRRPECRSASRTSRSPSTLQSPRSGRVRGKR